jgi:CBS-domain-containing membrane protein
MEKAAVETAIPENLADAIVVKGLTTRLGLAKPAKKVPSNYQWAIFMFINGFITIGLLAALGKISQLPFIFPSLGASAFLFFFNPTSASATPRNAIIGHALGAISGYIALLIFGLAAAPPSAVAGIDTTRVLALAFSFALAGALMIIFKAGHPPAGATALIVSLGIVSTPFKLIILMIAVVLLALQSIVINRLGSSDYPLWGKKHNPDEFYGLTLESAASSNLSAKITIAIFMFFNGFITIGILSGIAMILNLPFIFPSLGASAFLFFFFPNLPSSSPRNAICATLIAVTCGYLALHIFMLSAVTTAIANQDLQHILTIALSLALTGMFMILFKVPHPPAGATALIVSIGLVTSPFRLAIIELGIIALAAQAIVINRMAYIDYPIWQKK